MSARTIPRFIRSSPIVASLAAMLVAACSAAHPTPIDTVTAYAAALREARYPDAYALLSAEAHRSIAYDQFEQLARTNPDEVRDTVRWLDAVDPVAPATARLELTNGESLSLTEEHGQWRLDPAALDFYGQHTPRQALRSFVRALERRRYDVLVRFAPRRLAQGLTAEALRVAWEQPDQVDEVQAMVSALRASLNQPIEVIGDRATMQYGTSGRYVAQLVREDGLWKIEDPE